jgi:diguanylate cyclase (GGDEF)-like protein
MLLPLSSTVEGLADLTGFRDREALDVSLGMLLAQTLHPRALGIYRAVGDGQDRRWHTRAAWQPGQTAPTGDALWADPASLPRLQDFPERAWCLENQQPHGTAEAPLVRWFPIGNEVDTQGVLELHLDQPLAQDQLVLVAGILRVFRNFQGLLDYSERDTLTGLLNRKTFDEAFLRLTRVQPAAEPEGQRRVQVAGTTWLVVVDIDHFKRVNDHHGHLIGDEVLLLVARLMRSSLRYSDQLYRFGGEEFVVMLRCGTPADAGIALERLRANIEAYSFPQVGRITVSLGYTDVRPADTPAAAFGRADKAVYHVKANGRNQVAYHADLVASGRLADDSLSGDIDLF